MNRHRLIERPTKENALKNYLQEYVVTLKSEGDKQSFMQDKNIVSSQSQTIRQGKVLKCSMGADEAIKIQGDPRVESIEKYVPTVVRPLGFPSDQEKIRPVGSEDQSRQEEPILSAQALDRMATIQNLPDGYGVDVVVVDGMADPNNPEFANKADGTGGTRLNRLDWYSVLGSMLPPSNKLAFGESYPYDLLTNPDDPAANHGSHVMGTACGNTQGWASKANIYNISPYVPQVMWDGNFRDLYLQAIKIWHQNKPANPTCGNKNPTITNHSYGFFYPYPIDTRYITSINYRGQTITPSRNYSGAQCSAALSSSGGVGSITVTNGGSNYTNAPRVSFYGGGQATATAELASGSVYKITITDGGSGYTKSNPPTVTFSAPPAGGVRATGSIVSSRFLNLGAGATGPVVYVNENGYEWPQIGPAGTGQIYYVEITEAGSGYTSPPTVTFSDPPPGGRRAQATTEIKSGFVKRIRITNGGTGYFNSVLLSPAVILSGGNPTESAVIANGDIFDNFTDSSGSLLDGVFEPYIGFSYYPEDYIVPSMRTKMEIYFCGGGNYQTAPTVSFYGGNAHLENGTIQGTKPEAHAVLGTGTNANKVVSVVVDNEGEGYTSPPTVVLTNGGGFTVQQLKSYGLVVYSSKYEPGVNLLADIPQRQATIDEDVAQLISAGAVVVAAAGNSYYKMDTATGQDYNNSIEVAYAGYTAEPSIPLSPDMPPPFDPVNIHYSRGNSPGACPGVICVGAAGIESPEYKAEFSNTGPRIDVYAPGEYINSSVYPSIDFEPHGIADPRNPNYHLTKWSGTSMASPQVAGMLACYAQTNRNINQASATNFVNSNSKAVLNDGAEYKGLQGGTNKYAYMPNINHTTP